MTNYESGTRVPLFFRAPWIKSAVGVKSTALAELVDLFPTLSELAGLELPTGVGGAHLGGSSLVPTFRDPKATAASLRTCTETRSRIVVHAAADLQSM